MRIKKRPQGLFRVMMASFQVAALLFFNLSVARAGVLDDVQNGIMDASWSVFEHVLNEDLGISTSTMQSGGETANVIEYKNMGQYPYASITFTPQKPKVGEKMTAVAIASGFASDKSKNYYTWFLKRKGCDVNPSESSYDPGRNYGDSFLSDEVDTAEGEARSEKDCDLDGDNMITVNDWKVAASQEITRKGFEPDITGTKYLDTSHTAPQDPHYYDQFYDIHEDWNEKDDDDGYQAWQGGADGERMPAHCYGYNNKTGYLVELTRKSNGTGGGAVQACGDGSLPVCGNTVEYNLPETPIAITEWPLCECQYEDGHNDSSMPVIMCDECDGDTGSAACQKNSATCHNDHGISWHIDCSEGDAGYADSNTQSGCQVSSEKPYCENTSGTTWSIRCSGGATPICPDSTASVFGSDDPYGSFYGPKGQSGHNSEDYPVCSCENLQSINASTDLGASGASEAMCSAGDDGNDMLLCGGMDKVGNTSEQFHLFPWSASVGSGSHNYYELTRDYESSSQFSYRYGGDTGDGEFEAGDEEEFWRTDPRNPSTAGNSQSDEANIAGLGLDQFTWEYEEGDQVGFAVEGISALPTKFSDSSRMIFWAFSNGKEKDACQPQSKGTYQPDSSETADQDVQIKIGFLNFEKCMEKSVASPAGSGTNGGGTPTGLEVELSVSPEKPVNDETGGDEGDLVTVQANVSGSSEGEAELEYSWKIQLLDSSVDRVPVDSDWEGNLHSRVICGEGVSGCPFETSSGGALKTKGIGLSQISFPLNIDDSSYFNSGGRGYLKMSVEAKESQTGTSTLSALSGRASQVVEMTTSSPGSASNSLTVFKLNPETDIENQGSGTEDDFRIYMDDIDSIPAAQIICDTNPCEVSRNEIIGLRAPDRTSGTGTSETLDNFHWTKDGKAISCDETISRNCVTTTNGEQSESRVTFLPVTGSAGSTFSVTARATNTSGSTAAATGKEVEYTQRFKVVSPSVKIVPASGASVKNVGYQNHPATGASDEISSESIFTATPGSSVTLGATYSPSYIADYISSESWTIDGDTVTSPSFTAGEDGAVHTASLTAKYSQATEIYAILADKFNVSAQDLQDIAFSYSAQIEATSSVNGMLQSSGRFMANLFSRLPGRVLFLVKVMLSLSSVIVLSGMIFAFFPKVVYDRKRF